MSTLELVAYYVNLLIIQYASKSKATATIAAQATPVLLPQISTQLIAYQSTPASGSFVLSWLGESAAAISWDDDAAAIQTILRAVTGLELVVVTGDEASGFSVAFVGVNSVAALLVVESSTIDTGAPTVDETDQVLLLAIQDAFDPDTAIGNQLDVIGDYVGVKRTAQGATGPITLNDSDFRVLIKVGVLTNSAQSDLASIQDLLHTFFDTQIRVYDYQNMRMSYLIDSDLGSLDLIEMFISQGLLPRPMGVQTAAIIYAPIIDTFFGFSSYEIPPSAGITPFNDYGDYHEDWPWLLYENAVVI